ncbi:MAG: HAD-IIB family hydrolase [Lachnospiraceae bacterium]|nr:HAD-IIB family hydrolase [Lachnospiraceae bacterium]
MELWDLYDREGKRTGETWERKPGNYEKIPEGRYHLVSDILIRHKDGTYLLTKRHPGKDVYPGFWEASAGGSALAGEEPLQAAKREMFEETGLVSDDFTLVNVSFREPSHSMFYSYLAVVDADKDSVRLQEGETTEYRWVDKAGLLEYADSPEAMKNHNARYRKIFDLFRTLYVTDLDGTLMRGDKSISENSVATINRLIEMGMNFTVATARSLYSVLQIVRPFHLEVPMIVRNGTALADPRRMEIMEKALFTEAEKEKLKELLKELPQCGFVSIWHGGEMEKRFWKGAHCEGIEKYLEDHADGKGIVFAEDPGELFDGEAGYVTMIDRKEKLDPIFERIREAGGWETVLQKDAYGEEYWLEVCPENSTKAKAILALKKRLRCERVVVFGDSVNDIPMFRIADEAYAVENAIPELKECATAVIGSNEEDGVAECLARTIEIPTGRI